MTTRPALALAVALGLAACAPTHESPGGDAGFDDVVDGGSDSTAPVDLPFDGQGTPHASQLRTHDGRLLVADGFGGVLAYDPQLRYRWSSASVNGIWAGPDFDRCTSVDWHVASGTVYCAASDAPALSSFGVDDGRRRTGPNTNGTPDLGFRELRVVGDRLYLAAFGSGLVERPIRADGSLGDAKTVLDGDVRRVDGDGSTVVALTTSELVVLDDDVVTARVPLDGPGLRVRLRGGTAVVAEGSRGVLTVDLATGATTRIDPGCVALSADVDGDLLAVGCTSGARVTSLSRGATVAWVPASYSIVDLEFANGRLYVDDWRTLQALAVDPGATATMPPLEDVCRTGDAKKCPLQQGDSFPLPLSGEVYFFEPDCALQWPEVEDIADRRARGDDVTVVALPSNDTSPLSPYPWGPTPATLHALDPSGSSVDDFEAYSLTTTLGGADDEAVYDVEDGVVRSVWHTYRGSVGR